MTFDGLGQQGALFELGMTCQPDWEAVLTPVLDTLIARSDVEPDRIAAIGIGHGAYLLIRAVCFERRLAAAVADPGIVDLAVAWLERLSVPLRSAGPASLSSSAHAVPAATRRAGSPRRSAMSRCSVGCGSGPIDRRNGREPT
jgi:hypothetical protein